MLVIESLAVHPPQIIITYKHPSYSQMSGYASYPQMIAWICTLACSIIVSRTAIKSHCSSVHPEIVSTQVNNQRLSSKAMLLSPLIIA